MDFSFGYYIEERRNKCDQIELLITEVGALLLCDGPPEIPHTVNKDLIWKSHPESSKQQQQKDSPELLQIKMRQLWEKGNLGLIRFVYNHICSSSVYLPVVVVRIFWHTIFWHMDKLNKWPDWKPFSAWLRQLLYLNSIDQDLTQQMKLWDSAALKKYMDFYYWRHFYQGHCQKFFQVLFWLLAHSVEFWSVDSSFCTGHLLWGERIVFYPASSSLPRDSWAPDHCWLIICSFIFHFSLHSLVAHRTEADSRRSCRAPCSLGNISVGKYLSFRQLEKNIESDWRTRQADENAHYSRDAGKVLEIAVIEPILTGLGVPRDGRTWRTIYP